MNATWVKYNEDGKLLGKEKLELYLATSDRVPTICIKLNTKTTTLYEEVWIPIKQLKYWIRVREKSLRDEK